MTLQGIKWITTREEQHGLIIIQQSQPKYIDRVIYCIENGLPLLLENLPVDIDAVLDPVIGKLTIKKGRNVIMKIGDAEVEYDPKFRLYMQTKLSNPHYKPEISAQVGRLWARANWVCGGFGIASNAGIPSPPDKRIRGALERSSSKSPYLPACLCEGAFLSR